MPLLPAGSFRVSDYRKPLPNKLKLAVMARDYDVDHDPALTNRPFDTDAGDFVPPQFDPDHLVIKRHADHDEKTFGRKSGAEKTVTTRGSDVGERSRTRDIRTTEAIHKASLASKRGDFKAAAEILAAAPKQSRLKPKKPWPTARPFPQGRGFGGRREKQARG